MRILLIDDDAVLANVMVTMLQREGFKVATAGNGLAGVEMWENGNYDLVLMDVQMPVMDGLEATRTIRDRERIRGGHIPIIAITAFALSSDQEKCLAAGMDAFMAKPIDFRKCIESIRRVAVQGGASGPA